MPMTTTIILAAVINALLGVIALSKGKSSVNFSFAIMSFLFAVWNGLVAMWQGYGFEPLARVNFAVISLIPPAALYFVISLFGIKGRPEKPLLAIFLAGSSLYFFTTFQPFFTLLRFGYMTRIGSNSRFLSTSFFPPLLPLYS